MPSATVKSGLTFDAEKHRYFWNGKRVPGVSEIIKTVGLGRNYESVDTFYRDRGVAVHRAIQLYLNGTLDEESLDPVIVPYFKQAKLWLDERNISESLRGCGAEMVWYSPELNVAGTVDLMWRGKIIYDWKCTKSVDAVTEIQGAFYKALAGADEFIAIQLDGTDGPAKEIPYEAGPELVDAVMTLYRKWKRK
jgi:hypothetical protein